MAILRLQEICPQPSGLGSSLGAAIGGGAFLADVGEGLTDSISDGQERSDKGPSVAHNQKALTKVLESKKASAKACAHLGEEQMRARRAAAKEPLTRARCHLFQRSLTAQLLCGSAAPFCIHTGSIRFVVRYLCASNTAHPSRILFVCLTPGPHLVMACCRRILLICLCSM
jgi:hypothetical protein